MTPRKILSCSLVLLLSVSLVACSTGGGELSPERLGEIAAELHQNPDRVETILKKYELTREQFRQRLNEISSDPELSERYYSSFRQAKRTQQ